RAGFGVATNPGTPRVHRPAELCTEGKEGRKPDLPVRRDQRVGHQRGYLAGCDATSEELPASGTEYLRGRGEQLRTSMPTDGHKDRCAHRHSDCPRHGRVLPHGWAVVHPGVTNNRRNPMNIMI